MKDTLDLKSLPRVAASDGFTAEVLRRTRTVDRRRTLPSPRLALAGALVVVVSAVAGAWWARQSIPEPAPPTADSIQQMKLEQEALFEELESLHRLVEDTQPFVPVSIDPRTEILFDLRNIEPLPVRYTAAAGR